MAKIRLYVDHPLAPGQSVPLTEAQAHYLFAVMREQVGGRVLIFNGVDGEWLAEIAAAGKRGGVLSCTEATRPQTAPPDLWLLFAPVKKARTDMIVEKAVEMGAARILPVQTAFTNADKLRPEKAEAHVREAAEQCGATHVPEVAPLTPLMRVLEDWPTDRRILWANESLAQSGEQVLPLPSRSSGPWAILIGPEGGFSDAEKARLSALPFVVPIRMGPRILRAETAAIAAMALWQHLYGDWT